MGQALEQPRCGVEAYLQWEAEQPTRHDYVRGEVFAMTGGTLRHNRATLRSGMTFEAHLKGSRCKVFASDVKVAVAELASIGWSGPVASLLD